MQSPKEYIESIYADIQESQSSRIWKDSVNMLNTVSESVFSRSAHFILELLQNAEDASGGKNTRGTVEFAISNNQIRVTHNGRLFSEANCDAICGVRSTKKPEEGTLGFLGIGFKSVFKITDSPQIYSGEYRFKFDKHAHASPSAAPWQIMPLWLDEVSPAVDPQLTTFILPFRNKETYAQTLSELLKLDVHVFLFLKWLKTLRVVDEPTGETIVIENQGEENGVITVTKNKEVQRFVVFRRSCTIPDDVASDPALVFYKRQNVKRREVVIAFAVDEDGNVQPIEEASALGSVSSFLPLVEERSGAPFLIQADFLVQPGREAIQYELLWNHWLVKQASELAKTAISKFKANSKWGRQFLSLFNFKSYEGQAAFEKLFEPELKVPLLNYLKTTDVIAASNGTYVRPDVGVVLGYGLDGLVDDGDLELMFSGDEFHLVDPDVDIQSLPQEIKDNLKNVDIGEIVRNEKLLKGKALGADYSEWFLKLFIAMADSRTQFKVTQRQDYRGRFAWAENPIFVLTEDREIVSAKDVYTRRIPSKVVELRQRFSDVAKLLETYKFIHPSLDVDELHEFLIERTHVQGIDYDKICRKVFLPKVLTTTTAPSRDELIAYTRLLQKGPRVSDPIWVVTTEGDIKPSDKIFLSGAYSPAEDWEKTHRYSPQIDFVSIDYLEGVPVGDLPEWKSFFSNVGVKEIGGNNHVEMFAMAFTEDKLGTELSGFVAKHRQQVGYDREARLRPDNALVKLEIKGQKADQPVQLVDNEPKAAQAARNNGERFWVCVVAGIPEQPQLWVVEDPLNAGTFDTLKIDINQWKMHGRRVN